MGTTGRKRATAGLAAVGALLTRIGRGDQAVDRRRPRAGRRALLALLLAPALAVPLAAAGAAPAQAGILNEVTCTSSRAPWLADYLDTYLENDIDEPSLGNIAFEVYDRRTDTTCHMDRNRHFGSASTVKAIILAALLRKLEEGVALPDGWQAYAEPMILSSDTPAAKKLWPLVTEQRPGGGGTWIQHFLDLAGMDDTVPGPDGSWGDTQITAHDMTQLMKVFTRPGTVLNDTNREYILDLMAHTRPHLRWGVGQGAPPGTRVGVKIGIDDLGTRWNLTVHSVGFVEGLGRDYQMAILSDGTPDKWNFPAEMKVIENHIASVIHAGLNGLGWKASGSDRCLDVLDGLTGSGVRVQQWQCNLAFQQGWLLRRANAGNPFWTEWTFVNVNSGRCLGVIDQSTANGAEIQQQNCHGGTSQRWRLGDDDDEDGARRIWNVKSDKCVTADPATPGDGGRVVQLSCRGTDPFQQWAQTWEAPAGGGGGGSPGGGDPGDVPLVSAGPDVEGPEGTPIDLDGSTGGEGVTSGWSYAPVDGTGSCTFADASAVDTTITCDDNGTYTATLTVRENDGEPVSDNALVEVRNVPPKLTLTGPSPWQLFRVRTPVPVRASFTDPGNDTHTCQVVWDDGSTDDYAAAAHSCDRAHTFTRAGMFTLKVRVTDDDGASDEAEVMVVVYDPDAGFANADGSVASPAGALTTNPAVTGESWFSLTARYYKPNDTVPVGTARAWLNGTGFRFDAPGDRALEWLVVTPDGKVAAKGTGTMQGSSVRYGIVMYGTDAPDRYRVVVWPLSEGSYPTDALTYDNVAGAGYDVDVAQPAPLRSGIVTIHPPN